MDGEGLWQMLMVSYGRDLVVDLWVVCMHTSRVEVGWCV